MYMERDSRRLHRSASIGAKSQSHRGCYRSLIGPVIAVPSGLYRSPIGSPIGVCHRGCIGTAISAVPPPSATSPWPHAPRRYSRHTATGTRSPPPQGPDPQHWRHAHIFVSAAFESRSQRSEAAIPGLLEQQKHVLVQARLTRRADAQVVQHRGALDSKALGRHVGCHVVHELAVRVPGAAGRVRTGHHECVLLAGVVAFSFEGT
jgi:hypothetical protein